jgi:hypothetical protein
MPPPHPLGAFPANRFGPFMTSSTSVAISLKHREMVILGTECERAMNHWGLGVGRGRGFLGGRLPSRNSKGWPC